MNKFNSLPNLQKLEQEDIAKLLTKVDKYYLHANSASAPDLSNIHKEEEKEETKIKELNIHIERFLEVLIDKLLNKDHLICFCEREIICNCKDTTSCSCDNDDYYTSKFTRSDFGSNCNFLIEVTTDSKIKLNSKKNIRFFSLNKNNEEDALFDIIRSYDKDNNKLLELVIFSKDNNVTIPLFEGIAIQETNLVIKFNYMLYY
jgi:hypothetical protein